MRIRLTIILVACCFASNVIAGFGLGAVWYPDGVIQWFGETTPGPHPFLTSDQVNTVIEPTMRYMSERLPLTITRRFSSRFANLTFKKSAFDGNPSATGAWAYGYWAPDAVPKDIAYFSNGAVTPRTTAHEFGHALGMPHEHQRADAQGLLTLCSSEPFNYGVIPGPVIGNSRLLSPFDVTSRMIYRGACVTVNATGSPPPQPIYTPPGSSGGIVALYSRHDINSIYRVYGRALGSADSEALFGHATAVLDLDDDGFEDIAVAANDQIGADARLLQLYFYRGVATDPSERGAGRRYMPWFKHAVSDTLENSAATRSLSLILVAGDFDGDGRVELAVGCPDNADARRVKIFGQSAPRAFSSGSGTEPWGVKGLELLQEITPASIAPSFVGADTFAESLAVGRLTHRGRDDLLIGWPTGRDFPISLSAPGAVVHLQGTPATSGTALPLDDSTPVLIPNPAPPLLTPVGLPSPPIGDFGRSIAVVHGSRLPADPLDGPLDTLIVGAPGFANEKGRVYVFGSSLDPNGLPMTPSVVATADLPDVESGDDRVARFGQTLESVLVEAVPERTSPHFLVVGAPMERDASGTVHGAAGAVYLQRIAFGISETTVATVNKVVAPSELADDMQFGEALEAIQQDAAFDQLKVGISAPGANRVFSWQPFASDGSSSTIIESLPLSITAGKVGQSIQEISFGTGTAARSGFVVGAPAGIVGNATPGVVEVVINDQESLSGPEWTADLQLLTQSTTGDRLPD